MNKKIYLDHAATTPLNTEVASIMQPFFSVSFGNPDSLHDFGRVAAKGVIEAREKTAKAIGAEANEIYFTSSGSEADSWAVKGYALARADFGKHIITTKIEHPAVYNSCKQLEKFGFDVTYLPVDSEGFVSLNELENAIRKDTTLVSIMFANNEIGTVQPIKELAEIAHKHNVAFHTDAVQAVGSLKIDVDELNVDMLSLSAHKFYGPKGVGALFIRNGLTLENLISGGEQERNRRGGTTNVPSVVGLGAALALATSNLDKNADCVKSLRDRFVSEVKKRFPTVKFNGTTDFSRRLPNNANFSFEGIDSSIFFSLDLEGVCASSGSACSSGSVEPSRTLLAIGLPVDLTRGTIRFSFGIDNSAEEVDVAVERLEKIVKRLRAVGNPIVIEKGNVEEV